jgi:hypothetical protein
VAPSAAPTAAPAAANLRVVGSWSQCGEHSHWTMARSLCRSPLACQQQVLYTMQLATIGACAVMQDECALKAVLP